MKMFILQLWFRRNSGLRNSSKPEKLHSSAVFLIQTVAIKSGSWAITSKWLKGWKSGSCSGVEVEKKGKLSITIWLGNFRAYRNNRGDSADILHICGKHRSLLYKEPWEGEKGASARCLFALCPQALGPHSSSLAFAPIFESERKVGGSFTLRPYCQHHWATFCQGLTQALAQRGAQEGQEDARLLGAKQNQVFRAVAVWSWLHSGTYTPVQNVLDFDNVKNEIEMPQHNTERRTLSSSRELAVAI